MLDIPTLVIVSIFVMAILGLLLLLVWVQDRSIQALAWWGAAYLIAGLSIAMLSGQMPINQAVSTDIASALLFAACGLSWSGARLFDDKEIRPFSMFAGAVCPKAGPIWITRSTPARLMSSPSLLCLASRNIRCSGIPWVRGSELGRRVSSLKR